MKTRVLYNENDPHAAAWLRRLIAAGHLPPGVVDSRSILSLRPHDLDGFTAFHTFAGVGGWPLALRLAGWPDDLEVWTGSCPCQPFSDAGSKRGLDDERHLWPAFFRLIEERRPHVVFGEQVASKDGLAWLDVVSADLEGAGYAVGAVDTCAASVGAPHRRQRLYWVGYSDGGTTREHAQELPRDEGQHEERTAYGGDGAQRPGGAPGVGLSDGARLEGHPGPVDREEGRAIEGGGSHPASGASRGVAYGEGERCHGGDSSRCPSRGAEFEDCGQARGVADDHQARRLIECAARLHGARQLGDDPSGRGPLPPWRDCDWALCDDPGGPRWRPIEPGSFPLVDGAPERLGRLRGYGNAIVPQLAAEFVLAFLETLCPSAN